MEDTEFEIYHGDTLTNDWGILRELNPAKKPSFDAIVASPPFSLRWDPTEAMGDDVRFKNYGLAPKSAADFAFLLHGFHYLKDEGVMAIILPHGVLFRGGAEERIRTKLLKDGHIDTVIGLPANLFYSTGIPVLGAAVGEKSPLRTAAHEKPHLQVGYMAAPTSTCKSPTNPLPTESRPHTAPILADGNAPSIRPPRQTAPLPES